MSVVRLVEAASDRRLLGSSLELWPRQVELLRGLEGSERTHLIAAGRQIGKTTLAAMLAVHNAALRPDLDVVLPRRRKRYVLIASPGEDQSREFIDVARGLIEDSPTLMAMAEFGANRIEFRLSDGRRSCIQAMPANAKTVRGRSASLVILEEFAHFDSSAGPGSDQRMYLALRPSMRRFGGEARLVAISTPSGESGKFYDLFRDATLGVLHSARAVRLAAWDVDPSYTEDQREADRAELGELGFAEEVAAEFVTGRGSFFDLSGAVFESRPALVEEGSGWVAGLDAAFGSDFFGVALVGRSRLDKGVLVVGAVAAIDPASVRVRRASEESFEDERARQDSILAKAFAVVEPYAQRAVADLHKGGPIRSFFGRRGCQVQLVTPTATLQMQQFVALKARLEDGSLRVWAHPQLVQDLRRVRTTDGGKLMLPKFRGSHCDTVVALASAAWELKDGGEAAITVARGRLPEAATPPGVAGARALPASALAGMSPYQRRMTRRVLRSSRVPGRGGS